MTTMASRASVEAEDGSGTLPPDFNIVVVEHDLAAGDFLRQELIAYGARVNSYHREVGAVHQLTHAKIHALFVNINHPNLDGLSLIETARKTPSNKDIPVVALLDSPLVGSVRKAASAGAQYFLVSPYVRQHVVGLLRAMHVTMVEEKRLYQRVNMKFVVLCAHNNQRQLASSINVSASGMLFELTSSLALGDRVELTFPLNNTIGRPFITGGEVARIEGDRVAVAFADMPEDQRRRLKDWIEKSMPRQPAIAQTTVP